MKRAQATIPIRITKKRYDYLRKKARLLDTSLTWLVNAAIDVYCQHDPNYLKPKAVPQSASKEA